MKKQKKAIIDDFEKGPKIIHSEGEKWLQFDFDDKTKLCIVLLVSKINVLPSIFEKEIHIINV